MTQPDEVDDEVKSLLLPTGMLNEELLRTLRGPQASVIVPPDDQLAVRLIPERVLLQVFELEKEGALSLGLFNVSFGAMLSFGVNWVTSTSFQWTPVNAGFLGAVVATSAVSGVSALRLRRSALSKRDSLMEKS